MKIYDLHQDLLTHLRFGGQFGQSPQTSFESIKKSDIDLVVTTAFPCPPGDDQYHETVPTLITEELKMYIEYVQNNPDWKLVATADDLQSDKQKILLHLEGLNVFDGSDVAWQQLDDWVALGVRSVGTHWNVKNNLGGGTLQPEVGLTELGREVITYLEEHDLVFDLAHMSRAGFMDAAAVSTRPLYVSHGNADAVCPNVRNYTDEQLQMIAGSDGVAGVFFANTFVVGSGVHGTIGDVVAHIDHIKDLIGVRHIAIGSDLGGIISGGITDLDHVDKISNLVTALHAVHYTELEIEAICYKNAERVLMSHLG